jgi:hypothetical protein
MNSTSCQPSTGSFVTPVTGPTTTGSVPGQKNNVLFGPLSTSASSRMVCVEAGKALVFVGHSFGSGSVTLNRVWYTPGNMPQMDACSCPPRCLTLDPGHIDSTKPLSLACNGFVLSECSDTLVVSMPGCYNLTLDDEGFVGDTYVEYSLVDVNSVPAGMLAGNRLLSAPKVVAVIPGPSASGFTLIYDDGSSTPLPV